MTLLLAAGCSPAVANVTVCTAIFSYVNVVAVDSTGLALSTSFTVKDSVLRTGKVLPIAQQGYPPGTVTVFSDNNVADVSANGDSVWVTAVSATAKFTGMFQFGTDGCHIRRVAGPDTVVAH